MSTNNHIVKITKHMKINPYNGLSRKEGFQLEKDCLTLLNSNFECICGLNCNHFPKIIKCFPEKCKFILSNCGYSLNKYELKLRTKKIKPYKIKKIDEQIDCIIYNLKKCNIKHLDMHGSGKNICINKDGCISLIDFDIAVINEKCLSEKIKRKLERFAPQNYNGAGRFKRIISKIIK